MAEKRKRGQNFGSDEKDRLVKLIASHMETILNKRTDGTTNEAKNKAWVDVTNAFNSTSTIFRSKESLMKLWEKLKTESKFYYQSYKRGFTGTGGGPSEVKVDPVLEQVCALLGRACTGILGVKDCDADIILDIENIIVPQKICLDDQQQTVFAEYALGKDQEVVSGTTIDKTLLDNCDTNDNTENESIITKTPLWSRRRPQISKTNERTEAMSSLCSSFFKVNKRKEDCEDLKRQLLEDEIQFKRKLYELQLQAAAKEVEIKTEVLNQIKGGGMNLQNMFGVPQKDK